jgi:hypothetical protein
MIGRSLTWFASVLGAFILVQSTSAAQDAPCRYFKVQSASLNISKEPRGDAVFVDILDRGDVLCVTRDQRVGDRDWLYVAHKATSPTAKQPVDGWANARGLQQLSPTEAAAYAAPAAPAPPAPAASASSSGEDVIRYTEPVPFGPFPVNGRSIEQLIQDVPQFPPFEGLPDPVWKKPCAACHKWDRQTLCEQGATYAKNPRAALRHAHPYGGFTAALMNWAKSGCQ